MIKSKSRFTCILLLTFVSFVVHNIFSFTSVRIIQKVVAAELYWQKVLDKIELILFLSFCRNL